MTEKKTIEEYENVMYGNYEEWYIDSLVTILNSYKERGYTQVSLGCDPQQYDEGDSPKLQVVRHREETDEEYAGRIKLEDIRARRAESDRRRQYQQLRREFEANPNT